MKFIYFVLSIAVFSLSGSAEDRNAFCKRTWPEIQEELRDPSRRMAFANDGGLANGGVCWWHSRFQRAAVYLTVFAPEKNKPSLSEARRIIHSLSYQFRVEEIPGFANFNDFSAAYQNEIQAQLNRWQIRDGIGAFGWVRGLLGKSELSETKLRSRMNKIYYRYQEATQRGDTLWFKEQMEGIAAHASLVIDMKETADGYELELVDSNFPDANKTVSYSFGQKDLDGPSGEFVPYADPDLDSFRIKLALKSYCK